MVKFIIEYFWFHIIICMGISLKFPSYFSPLYPFLKHFLMTMLLIAFLKTDLKVFIESLKKPKNIILYSLFKLIFIPIFIWYLLFFLPIKYKLAFLLISSMPQGVSTPALIDLIGNGNIEKSIGTLILSYLIAPITIVGIFRIFTNYEVKISYYNMFVTLITLIIFPFIISIIVKFIFGKKNISKIDDYLSVVTVLMMLMLTLGTFSHESKTFLGGYKIILSPILLILLLFSILFILGFFYTKIFDKNDSITHIITTLFMNNTLAVVLSAQYFPNFVFFITVLTTIPWTFFLLPIKIYSNFKCKKKRPKL